MANTVPRSDMCEPAANAAAVTPSDSTTFAESFGLYVGGAGNVQVDMVGSGSPVLFSGVAAGSVLPIRVTRVYTTNTTATLIVRLY